VILLKQISVGFALLEIKDREDWMNTLGIGDYRPARGLTGTIKFFLVFIIIIFIVVLITYLSFATFASNLQSFGVSGDSLNTMQNRLNIFLTTFDVATFLLLPISLLVIVLFFFWVYRCAKNIHAFGCERLRFTPAWAVGWFFIPLADLVMPVLVLVEIWKASEPDAKKNEWQSEPFPKLIPFWWFFYIGTGFAPLIIQLVYAGPSEEGSLASATIAMCVLCGWEILWASLTYRVVSHISSQQEIKGDILVMKSSKMESTG
jgi:hypothetical protein